MIHQQRGIVGTQWYNQDTVAVSPALNAQLVNWLHSGRENLVFRNITYLFPARLREDSFIDDKTGRPVNDTYYHVAIEDSDEKFVWTTEDMELSGINTDFQLPPPISYVGFTQIDSANMYEWLLLDTTDRHDVRIRESLILRYNPNWPYLITGKYMSFSKKDVKIVGYEARGEEILALDENGKIFSSARWYDRSTD